MNHTWLLFCNVNAEGEIIESLHGANVIPDRQYQYFYFLTGEIDVFEYKVVDGELTLKQTN